jgi:PucR C-terminal helix-turn-helix domain
MGTSLVGDIVGSLQVEAVLTDRPWNDLPREAAAVLRPHLPGLADEIIAAISNGVPDYARPLGGPFGEGMRAGVEQALERFVDLVELEEGGLGPGREVYVGLGRGEMRAGRSLDALLAAYRLGARVAWRRLAAVGEGAGLDPPTLYLLAESIFAYIDEISAESIEGYAMEQAAAAGERERQRGRLAALLIQDPPADAAAVEAAALAAAWPLPHELRAVFAGGEDPEALARRLGADVIASQLPPGVCALVPDPRAPSRLAQLEAAFGDRLGAIGPPVPWQDAGTSAARARATHALAEAGTIPAGSEGLVRSGEHSVALLLHADPGLPREIARTALEPLDGETAASRARMATTLLAWLRHRGRTEQVANALHVHPQTVRYRLGRLRELYGERLEDPDFRFELELALRAQSADGALPRAGALPGDGAPRADGVQPADGA